MFRKLYRPTTQILNYFAVSKVAYCKQCVNLSSYRTVSSVAHKYNPPDVQDPRIDSIVIQSVDNALSKIDFDAKQFGRILEQHVKSVFEKIKLGGAVSSIQSLYLIRCCGSLMHEAIPSARILLLNEMWTEFQRLAVPMDASHYNALLKVYIENGNSFVPTDFLSTMEQNRITPNRVTYQRLIDKYCEDGDIDGARVVLDHMKGKEMRINLAIFNSLIKGHTKTGDLEGSKEIMQVMRQMKLEPSIETYLILAGYAAETGDINSVFNIIQEANDSKIYFMTADYLQLICRSATHGHKDNIDMLLSKLTNLDRHRHEISNIILDLINKGHDDIAYKIILFVAENINYNVGFNIFVKQLVKIGKPVEKVFEHCTEIRDKGINPFIFQIAAKSALENQNPEYILEIFMGMQKEGVPVRSHYFWPIFAFHKNKNNLDGISKTLKAMCDLGVPMNFDTYLDYIFPSLKNRDLKSIIMFIKETGHSEFIAIEPLFHFYCIMQDWKNIADLLEQFSVPVNNNYAVKLMASHYTPGDTSSVLRALEYISKNLASTDYNDSQDMLGKFLLHLLDFNKPINELLIEAYDSGCVIARATADQLCLTARKVHPSMMSLIRNLQFGKPLPTERPWLEPQIHVRDMPVEELENHLVMLQKAGASTRAALRSLLNHYCRGRNIDGVKKCLKELDDQAFAFTPAAYALMIGTFLSCGDLEEASTLKTRLDADFPDFKLDALKTLAYASLLVQHDKFEEAKEIIKNNCEQMIIQIKENALYGAVSRLLNVIAETKDIAFLKEMHNLMMVTFSIASSSHMFSHSLIKAYLYMDNLDLAIEEYKLSVMTYGSFSCRNLLFKTCIERSDNEKLQQVVDITMMHSEKIVSLHELVAVFIECGQLQQAQKVMQQLGERANSKHLSSICARLFREEKVTELEQLLHATKSLLHINRDELYFYLLQLYAQNNDCEKALELWNLFQEENVQPSVKTLRLLANLLENNDQPIPFVVPIGRPNSNEEVSELKPVVADKDGLLSDLAKQLEQQDASKVTETLGKMRKGHIRLLSIDTMRKIIDLHAVNDSLSDISKIVQVMSYIIEKSHAILKPLLQKYAESGDVKTMMAMFNFLPDFTQKTLGVNYFLNKVYLASGKEEELLTLLETNIGKNIHLFSTSGMQELLASAPHLEDRVEKLIDAYSTLENFDLPKRMLWIHYFVNGKDDKAEEIFKQNVALFNSFDPMALQIIKAIKNDKNVDLGKRFIDFINKFGVKDIIKTKAFSCVLDAFVNKSMFQDAAEFLKTSQDRGIPLSCFNRATLIYLHDSLKQQGQTLPFAIPLDSSSSSDSD